MSRAYGEIPYLKPVYIGPGIDAIQNGREAMPVFYGHERPLTAEEQGRLDYYQVRITSAWTEYDHEMDVTK